MKPFLELPRVIQNNEGKEVTVVTRVQPEQIEDYYPGVYYGTCMVMKSGNIIFCPLDVEQVDAMLAAYAEFIKKNDGKFGNLKLTPKPKSPILSVADMGDRPLKDKTMY